MSDTAPATETTTGPYHHGNLQEALLDAVGEIIAEKGVGGLSLREAARRAGVSHGAPAHHFGDKLGMLTAYSIRGLAIFGDHMRSAAAAVDTPDEKIKAIGLSYLQFAMEEPDYFGVMFRAELNHQDDQPFVSASEDCFNVLKEIATELALTNDTEAQDAEGTAVAIRAWSMVHGLATLWLDGAMSHLWDGDDIYELALKIFDSEL